MTTAIIAIALWFFLARGATPKPWSKPGTGTRREHRAAYAKEGFRI